MSEKYLSEAEIQNIAKYLEVKGCKPDPTKVWGRKMLYAAIATAASDKGYAVGIQDAAAWLRSFNDVSFPVGTYLADTLLAEKGAR